VRVSSNTATWPFDKILSVGNIEYSNEHSNVVATGPAVEQDLASFSTEVEEGRHMTPSSVSITEERKTITHQIPQQPSHLSCLQALYPRQPLDDPPFEVISRQHRLSVVSKTSEVIEVRSPGLEAARKRSLPSSSPARVDSGGQLARTAAYIRECLTRRSSACDELVCPTEKVPRIGRWSPHLDDIF